MYQYIPVEDQCPIRCQPFLYSKEGQLPEPALAEAIAGSLFSPDSGRFYCAGMCLNA